MTTITQPATERQVAFMKSLLEERDWSHFLEDTLTDAQTVAAGGEIEKRHASELITALMAAPRKARAGYPDLASLPVSKYLLDGTHFEIVERRGGRRYLNVLIGHPGDWARQRVSIARQNALVAALQADTYVDQGVTLQGPRAAAVRFSREYTVCAACMSPLSDPVSIAQGLGPICAGRF